MVKTCPLLESPIWLDFSFFGLLCLYLFFPSCILSVVFVINFKHCEYFWINPSCFVFVFIFEGHSKGKCHIPCEDSSSSWSSVVGKRKVHWCELEILGQLVFGGAELFCNLVFKGATVAPVWNRQRIPLYRKRRLCIIPVFSRRLWRQLHHVHRCTFTSPNYPEGALLSQLWVLLVAKGQPWQSVPAGVWNFHLEYHPNCSALSCCMYEVSLVLSLLPSCPVYIDASFFISGIQGKGSFKQYPH